MHALSRTVALFFILLLSLTTGWPLVALAQGSGTAFSYQGSLNNGSTPVDDICNFEFRLYDAASAGTQIGSTQSANSVTVSHGQFTVDLDFGSNAFTGSPRYLEVAVQCSSDASLTPLTPRQPLNPTPYSRLRQPGRRRSLGQY